MDTKLTIEIDGESKGAVAALANLREELSKVNAQIAAMGSGFESLLKQQSEKTEKAAKKQKAVAEKSADELVAEEKAKVEALRKEGDKEFSSAEAMRKRWFTQSVAQIELKRRQNKITEAEQKRHYQELLNQESLYASQRLALQRKIDAIDRANAPKAAPAVKSPKPKTVNQFLIDIQEMELAVKRGEKTLAEARSLYASISSLSAATASTRLRAQSNLTKIDSGSVLTSAGQIQQAGVAASKKTKAEQDAIDASIERNRKKTLREGIAHIGELAKLGTITREQAAGRFRDLLKDLRLYHSEREQILTKALRYEKDISEKGLSDKERFAQALKKIDARRRISEGYFQGQPGGPWLDGMSNERALRLTSRLMGGQADPQLNLQARALHDRIARDIEKATATSRQAEIERKKQLREDMAHIGERAKLGQITRDNAAAEYRNLLTDLRLYASERERILNRIAHYEKEVASKQPLVMHPRRAAALAGLEGRRDYLADRMAGQQAHRMGWENTAMVGRSMSYGVTMPMAALAVDSGRKYLNFEQGVGSVAAALRLGGGASAGDKGLNDRLSKLFLDSSTSKVALPINEVVQLGLQGAQAGVGEKALGEYIEKLYELKLLIPDMPTEQLAEKFNKLMVSTGKDLSKATSIMRQETGWLATAGAKSAAGSKEVLNASTRFGGALTNIGVSTKMIYSIAGAGTGGGLRPEEYGTQIQTIATKILRAKASFKEKTGGDSVLQILSGLLYGERDSQGQFKGGGIAQQKRFLSELQKDADQVFNNILKRMRELQQGGGDAIGLYDRLGLKNTRSTRAFFSLGQADPAQSVEAYYKTVSAADQAKVNETIAIRKAEKNKQLQAQMNVLEATQIKTVEALSDPKVLKDILVILDSVLKKVISLTDAFASLSPSARKFIVDLAAVLAIAGPAATVVGNIGTGIMTIGIGFTKLAQWKNSRLLKEVAEGVGDIDTNAKNAAASVGGLGSKIGSLLKTGFTAVVLPVTLAIAALEGIPRLVNWLDEAFFKSKLAKAMGTKQMTGSEILSGFAEVHYQNQETDSQNRGFMADRFNQIVTRKRELGKDRAAVSTQFRGGSITQDEFDARELAYGKYPWMAKPGEINNDDSRALSIISRIDAEMARLTAEQQRIMSFRKGLRQPAGAAKNPARYSGSPLGGLSIPGISSVGANPYSKWGSSAGASVTGGGYLPPDDTVGARAKDAAQLAVSRAQAALASAQEALAFALDSAETEFEKTGVAPSQATRAKIQKLLGAESGARTALARATAGKQAKSELDKFGFQLKPESAKGYIEAEVAQAELANTKQRITVGNKLQALMEKRADIETKAIQMALSSLEVQEQKLKLELEAATTLDEQEQLQRKIYQVQRQQADKKYFIAKRQAMKITDPKERESALGIAKTQWGLEYDTLSLGNTKTLGSLYNTQIKEMIKVLELKRSAYEKDDAAYLEYTRKIEGLTDTLEGRTEVEKEAEKIQRELNAAERARAEARLRQQGFEMDAAGLDFGQPWLNARRAARAAGRGGILGDTALATYDKQSAIDDLSDEIKALSASLSLMTDAYAFGRQESTSSFSSSFLPRARLLMGKPGKESDKAQLLQQLLGMAVEGTQASVGLYGQQGGINSQEFLTSALGLRQLASPKGANSINEAIASVLKGDLGNRLQDISLLPERAKGGALASTKDLLHGLKGWSELPEQLRKDLDKSISTAIGEAIARTPQRLAARRFEAEAGAAGDSFGAGAIGNILFPAGGSRQATGYGPVSRRRVSAQSDQWGQLWDEAGKSIKQSVVTGIWQGGAKPYIDEFINKYREAGLEFLGKWQGTIAEFGVYAGMLARATGAQGGKKQRKSLWGSALGFLAGSLIPGLGNMAGAAIGEALTTGGPAAAAMTYGAMQIGPARVPGSVKGGSNSGQLGTGTSSMPTRGQTIVVHQTIGQIGSPAEAQWYNSGLRGELERVALTGN